MAFDLIVLGAGPAGGNAALAASRAGLGVALLDEQASAGGQLWRKPRGQAALNSAPSPERLDGDALRQALARSRVHCYFGQRVWSVTTGFRVDALGATGGAGFTAPMLVSATGAHERVVPFPGWTLPGVMGLAAATVLLKADGIAPGRRVVVAGRGPLLAAVAAGVIKAGSEVAAVIDNRRRADWLRAMPALSSQPTLLMQGAGWTANCLARRTPWLFGHRVQEVRANVDSGELNVTATRANGASTRAFSCDALVVGDGLSPGAEVPRLLRADLAFDRRRGGWSPRVSSAGETSIDGLFAVGDGAGVKGAKAASIAGEIAGLEIARRRGRSIETGYLEKLRRRQSRLRGFSDAVAELMALGPAEVETIAPDTVVCRCEDVTRADIEAAINQGAHDANQLKHFTRCGMGPCHDANQLKHFTRCGMGPCQGRFCCESAQELGAQRLGVSREKFGYWTGRPPLRPVPLGALIGEFSYGDIAIPEPAPL